MTEVLGRTNQAFPRLWWALRVPHVPQEGWRDQLVGAALETGAPIDISTSPGLWGGALRGREASILARIGSTLDSAQDSDHAANLIQAEILQTLCAVGREQIDFLVLRVKRRREEFQIEGALQALEMAKQDGHARFLGLSAEGSGLGVLSTWQFHDAFEILMVPRNPIHSEPYQTLQPVARERRVGVVTTQPFHWGGDVPIPEFLPAGSDVPGAWLAHLAQDHPVLLGVRTPNEIAAAKEALKAPPPVLSETDIEQLVADIRSGSTWARLASDPRPWVQLAAQRRLDSLVV
ncbi:MAG TPA: hypothetical protein PLO61_03110 [Fimbriimonadaceae bacterium]|nr:hypothetical protein [Fimbriimonadaceae bacterium]HRJ32098.1 hypothetical protein [Fimbriimonadaceae bacterium]